VKSEHKDKPSLWYRLDNFQIKKSTNNLLSGCGDTLVIYQLIKSL